ncbi:FAD-dependent oxidoreductase [Aquihabitans sp. McL0605]|uniref:FAD-dependent oxidoreductase n=1 Tax=Aquihabitans sp. McL0605 TaxID=3415671 RepID=UPI003CF0875D
MTSLMTSCQARPPIGRYGPQDADQEAAVAGVAIAGGGFAGLMTSILLARRGHEVTVIERDPPPAWEPSGPPTVDDDAEVDAWRRAGAPQCRQSHVLLARARRVLVEEAPDVLDALLASGVREQAANVGAGDVPGEAMLLGRRLVTEAVIRGFADREPRVTVRSGDAVTALVAVDGAVPVVTGVRTQSGEVLAADLVVDAGGRRSALPGWLADLGARPPVDEEQPLGFFYLTRFYRVRPGCAMPVMRVPGSVPLDYATVIAFGGDSDTFSLTITLSVEDPHRTAMRDPVKHRQFLAAVPMAAEWLEIGDPISDIAVMARIENRRRRLVDPDGPVVGGLVPIGDASLHTNPTLGRGTAMAFWQGQQLANRMADPWEPIGLVDEMDRWTQENLGIWYDTQAAADAAGIVRLEAGIRGERLPMPDDPMARFVAGAMALAPTDPAVGSAVTRVVHLLASPMEAFGATDVAQRVTEFLETEPDLEPHPEGPTRAAFEAIATGAA